MSAAAEHEPHGRRGAHDDDTREVQAAFERQARIAAALAAAIAIALAVLALAAMPRTFAAPPPPPAASPAPAPPDSLQGGALRGDAGAGLGRDLDRALEKGDAKAALAAIDALARLDDERAARRIAKAAASLDGTPLEAGAANDVYAAARGALLAMGDAKVEAWMLATLRAPRGDDRLRLLLADVAMLRPGEASERALCDVLAERSPPLALLRAAVRALGKDVAIDPASILEEVRRLNRWRRVRIMTIGIGEADPSFMRTLAEENEGR